MRKKIEVPARGKLTDEAAQYYAVNVNRQLSVRELRLLPYIQNTVMNGGKMGLSHVNDEEIKILKQLDEEGQISFQRVEGEPGQYMLAVTNHFWIIMNVVLFKTYVVKV